MRRSHVGFAALTALTASSAQAAPTVRAAVVVDQVVDGRRSTSDAEAALMQSLAEDLVFIDPVQAQVVRRAASSTPLTEAPSARLVTSLDADVLIVGDLELSATDAGMLKDMSAYEGVASLRVVAVDSAQVLGTLRAQRVGSHHSPRLAAARVTQALIEALAPDIRKLVARNDRYALRVELSTPLDAVATDGIVRCVAEHPSTRNVQALHQDRTSLELQLTSDRTPRELALSFGQERPCGLFVYAYSARALRAEHAPEQVERLSLKVTRFRPGSSLRKRDRWLTEQIPRIVETELSEVPLVQVEGGQALSSPDQESTGPRQVALVGRVDRSGSAFQISARIVARSKTLVSDQASCPDHEVALCAAQLGERMRQDLKASIPRHRKLLALQNVAPSPDRDDPVRIERIRVPGVYPARVSSYDRQAPIGEIDLANPGDLPVEEIGVSAHIPGYSQRPSEMSGFSLPAGGRTSLPLSVWLDREKLASHDENLTVPLEVEVSYTIDGFRYRRTRSAPVMVFDRNAVNWARAPDSVAAFVDHRSPSVQRLVDEVRRRLPEALQRDPLGLPAALFRALDHLRYARDAVNPFAPDDLDYVLYPSETLARGSGDCDDLAVLYAALLEGAGYPAMLIQTPGHVMVAVGVGPTSGRTLKWPMASAPTPAESGHDWVPVETTRVGHSFLDAYEYARRELSEVEKAGEHPRRLVVRDAWQSYPPARLAAEVPEAGPAGLEVKVWLEDWEAMQARRQAILSSELQALQGDARPETANRRGILLALGGDLDGARRAFEAGTGSSTTRAAATNNLGNLELMAGRQAQALGHYERALKLRPDSLEVALNGTLAAYLVSIGDPAAEQTLARMMAAVDRIDPDALSRWLMTLPQGSSVTSASVDLPLGGLAIRVRRHVGEASRPTMATGPSTYSVQSYIHWLP